MVNQAESAPVPHDLVMPLNDFRTKRFFNTLNVSGPYPDLKFGILLTETQRRAFTDLHKQFNGSIRGKKDFEDPKLNTVMTNSKKPVEEVRFGNSDHQTDLSWETFNEVLNGIYGGKVTDPDLPKGIASARKIIETLKSGHTVTLRFYR